MPRVTDFFTGRVLQLGRDKTLPANRTSLIGGTSILPRKHWMTWALLLPKLVIFSR